MCVIVPDLVQKEEERDGMLLSLATMQGGGGQAWLSVLQELGTKTPACRPRCSLAVFNMCHLFGYLNLIAFSWNFTNTLSISTKNQLWVKQSRELPF